MLSGNVRALDRGDQTAITWVGDDPAKDQKLTYRELHAQVCKFANVQKARGVKKCDRVCIYMPMIPEVAMAKLACARIGAVHSVVFGGFSPESLKDRQQRMFMADETGSEPRSVLPGDEPEIRLMRRLLCFTIRHCDFLYPRRDCQVGKPDSLGFTGKPPLLTFN